MKAITLNLPEKLLELLDSLVEKKRYPNRAEAIRMAIKDLLRSEGMI